MNNYKNKRDIERIKGELILIEGREFALETRGFRHKIYDIETGFKVDETSRYTKEAFIEIIAGKVKNKEVWDSRLAKAKEEYKELLKMRKETTYGRDHFKPQATENKKYFSQRRR